MNRKYYQISLLFFMLLAFHALILALNDRYVLDFAFYHKSATWFSASPDQELQAYQAIRRWVYPVLIIYVLTKVFFVALILKTALYITEQNVPFHRILSGVVLCDAIFICQSAIKLAWFRYAYPSGDLADWNRLSVGSLLSLAGDVPVQSYFALQTINLFEVIYWFALAQVVSRQARLPFDHALSLVSVSYLPALALWVCLVTLFSLTAHPGFA